MDMRQLTLAVRLAETLHFGKAAELENIAQSGLSTQIAKLEAEVGFYIFDRTSRRVALTEAGELFIQKAKQILNAVRGALQDCQAAATQNRGVLRIGFFGNGAIEPIHGAFDLFRHRNPGILLKFVELRMPNQIQALIDGAIDVALVYLPFDDERLELTPILGEPRVVAVPFGHPMADAPSLHVYDLQNKPFAMACEGTPSEWISFWSLNCDQRDARTCPRVSTIQEGLATVAYKGAFDTLPLSATRFYRHPGVRYIPLLDASQSTLAFAKYKDNNNPAIQAFRQCVETIRQFPLIAAL
ncbi:MAG: LysR family transcriptional regulator [Achromobacter sp.]|uniref:LysR substrate-binding domain-containing protein n=1 Tax=Achromobacter sp. TaxID=134375 RepID=UPI0029A62943|nr:LysR family transcriptional regulator [Achromobacter sp.]MDX3985723.1 LysR family transcriptional regulator [Achromobacter sp.]